MINHYNPVTTKTVKTVVTEETFDSEGNLTKRVVTETTETNSTGGGYGLPPVYADTITSVTNT